VTLITESKFNRFPLLTEILEENMI